MALQKQTPPPHNSPIIDVTGQAGANAKGANYYTQKEGQRGSAMSIITDF